MASVSICKELSAKGGRYVATVEGIEAEAELVFTQRDPALVSADHALAPESVRGTGAAHDRRRLRARLQNPAGLYKKHPGWRDVMSVDPE
jgi:hypothetical protein